MASVTLARAYFAVQAATGAIWWVLVFASDDVRRWTLGGWNPGYLVGPDITLVVVVGVVAAIRSNRIAAVACAGWTTAVTLVLGLYALVTQRAGVGAMAMTAASVASLAAAATIWFGRLPVGWFFIGPFRFREADDRPPSVQLRRSLMQLVVFWSTFFILIPLVLGWIEDRLLLRWPTLDSTAVYRGGAVLFVVASAMGLWSCVTMALIGHGTPLPAQTAPRLVVRGPYRFVRNPMAVAGGLQTIGVGLWLGSWSVVAIAVAGAVIWNELIRPTEEADLAARFGAPYDRYRATVRCWIPAPRRPR